LITFSIVLPLRLIIRARKNTIVSCIYRKPGTNIEDFVENIEKCIDPLKNKNLYICGDLNIDLLKYDSHQPTKLFIHTIFSLGLLPLITKPTRITTFSETLIDNIFTNVLSTMHISGAFITDISDHLPIFSISNDSEYHRESSKTYIYKRKLNESNLSKLNTSLENESWQNVFDSGNADDSYDEFIKVIMQKLNHCCP